MSPNLRILSRRLGAAILAGALMLAALLSMGGSGIGCKAQASSTIPSDYCYKVTVTITNATATTYTYLPVRFTMPASDLISNRQLDQRAWQMFGSGSTASQNVGITAQTLTSTQAGWWVEFVSIASGASPVNNVYFGNDDQQRDQGILFAGADTVTTAHHADFDVSNNLDLRVEFELFDTSIATATLASHWTANTGYKLEYGASNLRATVGSNTLSVPWDSSWTDETIDIQMTFVSPNIAILVDEIPQGTLSTGLGSIPSASATFDIGTSLNKAYIRDVRLYGGSPYTVRAIWGFDADSMSEFTSVSPYTGVIQDYAAGSHDLSYSFVRGWMAESGGPLTPAVSRVLPASVAPPVTIPTTQPSQTGPLSPVNLFTPVPTSSSDLLGAFLNPITTDNPVAGQKFLWALMIGGLSLLITALIYARLPAQGAGGFNIIIAGVIGMLPVIWAAIAGHLPWWWVFVWIVGLMLIMFGVSSLRRPA